MAHDVFISHSSQDKQIADAMCDKLESSGIRCWMAPRDIPPGVEWARAIVLAINKCQLMVVVFSSNANSSHQIMREVERAASKGVMIVPVRIEDVPPSDSLEFYLCRSHWLDAVTPPVEQHLQRLVENVTLLLSSLPKEKVVSDDEEIVREKEEARRRVAEDARRREEELERKRQEAEELKRKQQEAEAEAARKAKEISTRMPHDVFISYSSKDRHVADAMCNKLESNGIRCWMAPRNILAGMDWGGAIMDAIKKCQLMVLVFSSNANASQVIKREVERAASKGVMVVPFRIEDVQPAGSLELYLSTSHWLDALTPPVEQHLQRLVEDVKELMPMLPTRVVNDVEGMTLVSVDEQAEASQRADRAREEEEVRRRAEEDARRRAEATERKRLEAEELKRKQQDAEAGSARKGQDALLRQKVEETAPMGTTAAQHKELKQKALNRMWGWGLATILISSFVMTLASNSGIPVAVGLLVLCPIFSVYVILKERKSDSHENKKN